MLLKKKDLIFLLFLLMLSFLPLLFNESENESCFVHITVNNEPREIIQITPELQKTIRITTEYGTNIVQIEHGKVSVSEADCPDHICVKSPAVSRPGEIIACLPHKLLIEIRAEE